MKTCVCCNAEVENSVKFCPYCGKSLFKHTSTQSEKVFADTNSSKAEEEYEYQSSSMVERSRGVIWGVVFCIALVLLFLFIADSGSLNLFSKKCSNCGDKITGEAVTAGDRNYCSYNCYMSDFFSGK